MDAKELERLAASLTHLARGIVGDVSLAEDVVQGVFLSSLPNSNLPAEAPWLRRLVRFRALDAVRRRRRAPSRIDQAAGHLADERSLEPARTTELLEARTLVLEAVNNLKEPYRSIISLRFLEGNTPAEIARMRGIPTPTVKTQITRGLAKLRSQLEHRETFGAIMLVAYPRGRFESPQAPLLSPQWVTLMTIPKAFLLLLPIALILGWFAFWSGSDEIAQGARAGTAETSKIESPRLAEGDGLLAPTRNQREAPSEPLDLGEGVVVSDAAEAPGPSPTLLSVKVLWPEGSPAVDIRVIATVLAPVGKNKSRAEPVRFQGLSNAEGIAIFKGPFSGREYDDLVLSAERGDGLAREPVKVERGTTTNATLHLVPGHLVQGEVVDENGNPVADAGVWLTMLPHGSTKGRLVASSDSNGRFELQDVPFGSSIGAVSSGLYSRKLFSLDNFGSEPTTISARLVLDSVGAEISGKLVDYRGAPVQGAEVTIFDYRGEMQWEIDDETGSVIESWSAPVVTTDGDGRFHFPAIRCESSILIVKNSGYPVYSEAAELKLGGENFIELTVPEVSKLKGCVRDEEGAPVPGAIVLTSQEEPSRYLTRRSFWGIGTANYTFARADSQGCYSLSMAMSGDCWLLAIDPRDRTGKAHFTVHKNLVPGEQLVWDVTVPLLE